jgi:hypothetical protein
MSVSLTGKCKSWSALGRFVNIQADDTLKSWTFESPNPEGLSYLRLNMGFLDLIHMGPSNSHDLNTISSSWIC